MLTANFGIFAGDDGRRARGDAVELEGARQGGPTGRRACATRLFFDRGGSGAGGVERFANIFAFRDVRPRTGIDAAAATGRQQAEADDQ
jgi:hypothetical protein